ncbi:hypothetical protein D3C80_1282700 [compost metagenome]
MHVARQDAEHFLFGGRLVYVEQALIFHPADNRRQHFGILMRLARAQYLEQLARALQQDLLMRAHQFGQARVEQRLLTERLLGHQMFATIDQLPVNVIGHQPCNVVRQFRACLRAAIATGDHVAQQALVVHPQLAHVRRTAFHVLGEGIGEQVIDILEIVSGRRQRHLRLGGHRTVPDGTHAIAHDNAHRGVENVLSTLLTALSAGLAALVLNTFSDRSGDTRCTFLSHCTNHDRYFLSDETNKLIRLYQTGNKKPPEKAVF